MRKLLKSFWTPDEHGERPAVLFLTAAAGFGSILSLPWIIYLLQYPTRRRVLLPAAWLPSSGSLATQAVGKRIISLVV